MIELRRGDVVFYGERGEYSGKLRPGVIVQRDSTLADSPSITLCGITSFSMPTHAARVSLSPSPENGLEEHSFAMIDKIATIGRSRVRRIFGRLSADEMNAIDRALRAWLEL
jgi:mRNA interferase MazF